MLGTLDFTVSELWAPFNFPYQYAEDLYPFSLQFMECVARSTEILLLKEVG